MKPRKVSHAEGAVPETARSPRHFLLWAWVIFFLVVGLYQDTKYVIYRFDLQFLRWLVDGALPIFQCLAYGSLIGLIAWLAMASKPITGLGALKLTVFAGFFIVLLGYGLDLLDGLRRFYMGWSDLIFDYDWLEAWIGAEIEYPGWLSAVTFVSLGYVLTRHKGLRLAAFVSTLVALAFAVLGWILERLALVSDSFYNENFAPWELLTPSWPEVLALLVQAGILAFFSFVGAILTRVRLPLVSLPQKRRRYRPARRIAHHGRVN